MADHAVEAVVDSEPVSTSAAGGTATDDDSLVKAKSTDDSDNTSETSQEETSISYSEDSPIKETPAFWTSTILDHQVRAPSSSSSATDDSSSDQSAVVMRVPPRPSRQDVAQDFTIGWASRRGSTWSPNRRQRSLSGTHSSEEHEPWYHANAPPISTDDEVVPVSEDYYEQVMEDIYWNGDATLHTRNSSSLGDVADLIDNEDDDVDDDESDSGWSDTDDDSLEGEDPLDILDNDDDILDPENEIDIARNQSKEAGGRGHRRSNSNPYFTDNDTESSSVAASDIDSPSVQAAWDDNDSTMTSKTKSSMELRGNMEQKGLRRELMSHMLTDDYWISVDTSAEEKSISEHSQKVMIVPDIESYGRREKFQDEPGSPNRARLTKRFRLIATGAPYDIENGGERFQDEGSDDSDDEVGILGTLRKELVDEPIRMSHALAALSMFALGIFILVFSRNNNG